MTFYNILHAKRLVLAIPIGQVFMILLCIYQNLSEKLVPNKFKKVSTEKQKFSWLILLRTSLILFFEKRTAIWKKNRNTPLSYWSPRPTTSLMLRAYYHFIFGMRYSNLNLQNVTQKLQFFLTWKKFYLNNYISEIANKFKFASALSTCVPCLVD